MSPVNRAGLFALLLAWSALVLPWERCASECHDRVRLATDEHDCHGPTCPGEGCGDAEHESVRQDTMRPSASDAPIPAAIDLKRTWDAGRFEELAARPSRAQAVSPSPRPPGSVALLL